MAEDWVKFHRDITRGKWAGYSRATRFVLMELALLCKPGGGRCALPPPRKRHTDMVGRCCLMLGGDIKEARRAVYQLSTDADAEGLPTIVFELAGGGRVDPDSASNNGGAMVVIRAWRARQDGKKSGHKNGVIVPASSPHRPAIVPASSPHRPAIVPASSPGPEQKRAVDEKLLSRARRTLDQKRLDLPPISPPVGDARCVTSVDDHAQPQLPSMLDDAVEHNQRPTSSRANGQQVQRVFAAWAASTGHQRARLDAKRRRRIQARLNEGFTADELIQAITNRRNDPWLMGQGDSPRVYDGLDTLLRDAAQVERLRDLTSPLPVRCRAGGEDAAEQAAIQRRAEARRAEEWMRDDD